MKVLLEDIVKILYYTSEDIQMKALLVFRNALGHMTREEASPIALKLAEKLLLLFSNVRLLQEPEPQRWARCKESCLSAKPCSRHSGRAAPLCAPLGSAAQHGFSLTS